MGFYTVKLTKNAVSLLDQRKLPLAKTYITLRNYDQVAKAIENMSVRGAPAIGVTAALGIALGANKSKVKTSDAFRKAFKRICKRFSLTRPTAVNLFWAISKMQDCYFKNKDKPLPEIKKALTEQALKIAAQDEVINQMIGKFGSRLIKDGDTILTHCNAGALATAGFGTALGVIRSAIKEGKDIQVYADETRPLLQGARLTAWELVQDKIDVTLIIDNMAGYLMAQSKINKVIVGADRIAANGDTANKIGTYSLAVLAKNHSIPFFVAAPLSTIDFDLKNGKQIPIEERASSEVRNVVGRRIAPANVKVENPAFDVTPAKLISAIITEKGIVKPALSVNLKRIANA
ncbi:MAG: S-methyl-5-thioribose-1-phosphate isomerase [Actinobacteria bacterium]|nr:MAG: S-methyl-5-thioribose-1-phosphate isomerase [Actinomycetota bacterium]